MQAGSAVALLIARPAFALSQNLVAWFWVLAWCWRAFGGSGSRHGHRGNASRLHEWPRGQQTGWEGVLMASDGVAIYPGWTSKVPRDHLQVPAHPIYSPG